MNRRSAIQTLVGMSAGSLFQKAFGDNPPNPLPDQIVDENGDFILRSEARLVLLDVSVQDRAGGFVQDLEKGNFKVAEDGHPQEITVFDHGDLPVTVGLIMDESRSMTPKREDVLGAATTFIQESNPFDELFVINFNDRVTVGLPSDKLFSGDIGELQAALYRGVPQGKTALYDGVMAGLKQLELGQKSKKALIVISDGGDNASVHTRQEVFNMVLRSVATIYTIGIFDKDDPDVNPGILQGLAKVSGGEALFPASAAETEPACRRLAHEIRTRYTIGYRPNKGSRSLRRVNVQVASPGHEHLIVRARDRYWYGNIESQN